MTVRLPVSKSRRDRIAGGALMIAICAWMIGFSAGSAEALDNPLGVALAPTNGDPLRGARFFVDHENAVSLAARQYPALRVIADQPGTARFGAFSGPDVGPVVRDYLVRVAAEPGTVPMLATYRIR